MGSKTPIRRGTRNDITAIFQLLTVMHAENGEGPLSFGKTTGEIGTLLDSGIVLVAVIDDQIVGSIGLYEAPLWYSDAKRLSDLWTFVHPDHRKSRIATSLIAAAKEAAAKRGLTLNLGITTPIRIKDKMRFYEHVGFRLIGALYAEGR